MMGFMIGKVIYSMFSTIFQLMWIVVSLIGKTLYGAFKGFVSLVIQTRSKLKTKLEEEHERVEVNIERNKPMRRVSR